MRIGFWPGDPLWWMFALVALTEALLGALIGFFAAIPFWVAENVGNFIDNQRGGVDTPPRRRRPDGPRSRGDDKTTG